MDFTALDVGPTPDSERPLYTVTSTDPAAPGYHEKELTEAGLVRSNDSARLDANAVDMCLPASLAQRKRIRSGAVVHRNWGLMTGSEIQKAHGLPVVIGLPHATPTRSRAPPAAPGASTAGRSGSDPDAGEPGAGSSPPPAPRSRSPA